MKTITVRCAGSYAGSNHTHTIVIGPVEWQFGAEPEEFDKEAQILCNALRDSLPGGVLDRLLEKMNAARAEDEKRWASYARRGT